MKSRTTCRVFVSTDADFCISNTGNKMLIDTEKAYLFDCLVCYVILSTNITKRFDNSFCVFDIINSLLTLCAAQFVRIQQSVTSASNSLPVTGN